MLSPVISLALWHPTWTTAFTVAMGLWHSAVRMRGGRASSWVACRKLLVKLRGRHMTSLRVYVLEQAACQAASAGLEVADCCATCLLADDVSGVHR
jgi:hypothetical protein